MVRKLLGLFTVGGERSPPDQFGRSLDFPRRLHISTETVQIVRPLNVIQRGMKIVGQYMVVS